VAAQFRLYLAENMSASSYLSAWAGLVCFAEIVFQNKIKMKNNLQPCGNLIS